jgi:hypothetical protein
MASSRSTRRSSWTVAVLAVLALAVGVARAPGASASDPASQDVKVQDSVGTKVYTWTGEVSPVPSGNTAIATDPCVGDPDFEDIHTLKIDLPPRLYSKYIVEYTFQITWEDPSNDIELLITGPTGTVGSSHSADPVETVPAINLDEGTYEATVCTSTAVDYVKYKGQLKMVAKDKSRPKPTTTTSAPKPAAAGESGGGAPTTLRSSGASVAPAPAALPRRSSAGPVATPTTIAVADVAPVEAAPPAFISSGVEPESAAPPPRVVLAEDTPSLPLGAALAASALGVAGLAAALVSRRRRGLDREPGTSVVPVTAV